MLLLCVTCFSETDEQTIQKLMRIVGIWEERKIFDSNVLSSLRQVIGMWVYVWKGLCNEQLGLRLNVSSALFLSNWSLYFNTCKYQAYFATKFTWMYDENKILCWYICLYQYVTPKMRIAGVSM